MVEEDAFHVSTPLPPHVPNSDKHTCFVSFSFISFRSV